MDKRSMKVKSAAGALGICVVILALCGFAALTKGTAEGYVGSTGLLPLPPPGMYKVDPMHSFAYFAAWHHIVGRVRGRFDKVTGTITAGKGPTDCAVDISIDSASIDTQVAERDEDLRGPDFFDVKEFPAMTYQGRGIRQVSDGSWVMDGSLTIRGVTKAVPLTFRFEGLFPDTPPGKPARASFHATTAVRRGDFGMTRDNLMELGPNPKGTDVEIQIDVEADAASTSQ